MYLNGHCMQTTRNRLTTPLLRRIMQSIRHCMQIGVKDMNDVHMEFDELLTMKALMFKADISGRASTGFAARILERDPDQAEAIGLKNICFRIDPLLQARFEVTLDALGMSKQEALSEALHEMLNQFDAKLKQVGLGPIDFTARLRELGFEQGPETEHGRALVRVEQQKKGA